VEAAVRGCFTWRKWRRSRWLKVWGFWWTEEGNGDMRRGKERKIYLAKGPGEGKMGGVSTVRAYIVGKKTETRLFQRLI